MAGYINPDGQVRLVTKVFGNTNGKTVRAKSLWTNKDGVPTCIYREGERDLYIVGLSVKEGNSIFPMAYSYDLETFKACSITMPSGYTSYKPNAIKNVYYSEKLKLFVALGYYLPNNYTTNSTIRWYMMYSEDGKKWEVSKEFSYTYYSTWVLMVYDKEKDLFLIANQGVKPGSSGFYFYSSTDGKNWNQVNYITPINAANNNIYTAYNIGSILSPGDGYIYLSGTANSTFYDGSKYYPFLRTSDGVNFELYGKGTDYNDASLMYGSRSLLYNNGVYYSLDKSMYLYNSEMTSQSKDYYTVGIHKSSDNMQSWEYIPLDVSSINKDWDGSQYDGFFIINYKLFCSITKDNDDESYLYSSESGLMWEKESVLDGTLEYLIFPVSEKNLFQIEEKFYRTHAAALRSTVDGIVYVDESELAERMKNPFNLSSSSYVLAVKKAV